MCVALAQSLSSSILADARTADRGSSTRRSRGRSPRFSAPSSALQSARSACTTCTSSRRTGTSSVLSCARASSSFVFRSRVHARILTLRPLPLAARRSRPWSTRPRSRSSRRPRACSRTTSPRSSAAPCTPPGASSTSTTSAARTTSSRSSATSGGCGLSLSAGRASSVPLSDSPRARRPISLSRSRCSVMMRCSRRAAARRPGDGQSFPINTAHLSALRRATAAVYAEAAAARYEAREGSFELETATASGTDEDGCSIASDEDGPLRRA